MLNLLEFSGNDPETVTYIEKKISKLCSCMDKNRKYKQSLEQYLANLESQMKALDVLIQRKKEKKKSMQILKFLECSPYIEFYLYDKQIESRTKMFCFLNMLNKSPNFKNIHNPSSYEKLITLSTSSEDSSIQSSDQEDFENFEDLSQSQVSQSESITSKTGNRPYWKNPKDQLESMRSMIKGQTLNNQSDTLNSPLINNQGSFGKNLKMMDAGYRNNRILEILNQFNISPKNFDAARINWITLAKKINTSTFLMKIPEHRAVSPIEIYQYYLKHYQIVVHLKKWTLQDDQKLIFLVDKYGDKNWSQIAQSIEGKDTYGCFHRFYKKLDRRRVIRRWNLLEDYILGLGTCVYRKENGNVRWIKISKLFNNSRTDVQCRERFKNILDPELKNINLEGEAQEDHKKLIRLYQSYGPKWSKIAKEMGSDRTDNFCKRVITQLRKKGKIVKHYLEDEEEHDGAQKRAGLIEKQVKLGVDQLISTCRLQAFLGSFGAIVYGRDSRDTPACLVLQERRTLACLPVFLLILLLFYLQILCIIQHYPRQLSSVFHQTNFSFDH